MGLNRFGAKRDRNESEIHTFWRAQGHYVQPVSSRGQPDCVLWIRGFAHRAETKMRTGRLTEAQVEEFTAALLLGGVKTWVVRSLSDAAALLDGRLSHWTPEQGNTAKPRGFRPGRDKARSVAEMCAAFGCARSQAPGKPVCDTHDG